MIMFTKVMLLLLNLQFYGRIFFYYDGNFNVCNVLLKVIVWEFKLIMNLTKWYNWLAWLFHTALSMLHVCDSRLDLTDMLSGHAPSEGQAYMYCPLWSWWPHSGHQWRFYYWFICCYYYYWFNSASAANTNLVSKCYQTPITDAWVCPLMNKSGRKTNRF